MKKSLLSIFIFLAFVCNGTSQEFITTWKTINNADFISFGATTTGPVAYTWQSLPPAAPASGSGTFIGPNVTISGLTQNASIKLMIQPQNFKRIYSNDSAAFTFSLEYVNQWGSVEWISMENAFRDYSSLQVTATDFPDLSNVTSLESMFEGCQSLNSPFNINNWNVSNIENISAMFKGCLNFNQALSLWDTSNITDMSSLFEGARQFNQNIGNWNTSNVNDMSKLFKDAFDFNRNIGNWNTSNVTNMFEMFNGNISAGFVYAFNQDIGNWNTSGVTNMSGMFKGAVQFNKNISDWNTSNVTDMSDMFNQAFVFNQNIGNWQTSNVTNMAGMFANDFVPFAYPLPTISQFDNGGDDAIENWNTANVTNMSKMFFRAENFNASLATWTLNQDVNLTEMLDRSGLDCKNYSQTIIGWNNNPTTPNNKILGATFLEYGPGAQPAINNLIINKGWGFSGHDFLSVMPEFDLNTTFCEGSAIPALPTVSQEGIPGIWSPAINSTQTTTYTFVPEAGECASTTTVTLIITPFAAPSGVSPQSFAANSTLSDVVISPNIVLWYASADDALNDINPLSLDTLLEDGVTYFAVNDNGECRSQSFPVTVSITLGIGSNDPAKLEYYPNPVSAVLTIVSKTAIAQVAVYNLQGQKVLEQHFNDTTSIAIDLNNLPKSMYLIRASSDSLLKEFKIVKQ